MNVILTPVLMDALRQAGENLSLSTQTLRIALDTSPVLHTKETKTVTTEDQLLSVIASAQEKLAAIRRLPREEPSPVDSNQCLAFKFHLAPSGPQRFKYVDGFTFLALRVPSEPDTRSWYITGGNRLDVKNPMTWNELREFMSSRGVDSFESLYTRDEWHGLKVEASE